MADYQFTQTGEELQQIFNDAPTTKETANQNALDIQAEETARENADTTLTNRIAAEETNRYNADQALNTLISSLSASLANYYLKTETYNKTQIDEMVATINAAFSSYYTKTESNSLLDTIRQSVTAETQARTSADNGLQALITNVTNSLVNYYLKSETYSRAEVQQLISAVQRFSYVVAAELPTASADTVGVIYLIPSTNPKTKNVKDEFITITETSGGSTTYYWEQIGSTTVDLSGYYTSTQTDAAITAAINAALTSYYTKTQIDTLIENYYTKAEMNTALNGKQDTLTFDDVPTAGSNNPVKSSGIKTALDGKQTTLTFDDAPTENSNNPVKSGGVYKALIGKKYVNYIYIDQNIADPNTRVTGDINGDVIKWIRSNSHRYLGKYTAEGTMTLCQLSDTDTTKFDEDDTAATLDGTQGDVFMQHPTFYTNAVEVKSNVWRIGFATYQVDSAWKEWNENDIIGVYEAAVTSEYNGTTAYGTNDGVGYMRSISGVDSQGSVSQANFKTKARNRGTGFTAVKWQHQNIMAFLYYAKYGNTNCQAQCGSGTNSFTKSTGQTDSLGITDTTSANGNSMSINFWGLENWWGNKYEWVDNVVVNGNKWNITEDDNTTRQVTGQSAYNVWVSPMAFTIGQYLDVIPLPTQSGGSDSTGYCDGVYMPENSGRVVLRSCADSNALGGVACAACNGDSVYVDVNCGSRLAFKGTIVKASKADFLAATAIG